MRRRNVDIYLNHILYEENSLSKNVPYISHAHSNSKKKHTHKKCSETKIKKTIFHQTYILEFENSKKLLKNKNSEGKKIKEIKKKHKRKHRHITR